jgi:glycosyltransferase involved in cell wall biosynthesis
MVEGISVIMPTYNQAGFICRAILSLLRQSYEKWELIIVNDGSTDGTEIFISDYLEHPKVTYIKNLHNRGIGYAINQGLDIAKYGYIAYLPSDDFYDTNHLESLKQKLDESEDIVLAFSGLRYDDSPNAGILVYRTSQGLRPGYSLQLVQVCHRKTIDRWIERVECVSEDLFFTFWRKLTDKGVFIPTNQITSEWTFHPYQRHKIMGERFGGGLNKYRYFYKVQHPIRMRTTHYKTVDENTEYIHYRDKKPLAKKFLKILLVGELAYNPERVYAFEEAGHKLYGLWSKPEYCFCTVGPLPFGNVEDIPYEDWQEKVKEIAPDIIYAQLNTGSIELAHEVLNANTGIPFVWHFKEGPHGAMKQGLWDKLVDLYTYSNGKMYLNDEIREWFEMFVPDQYKNTPTFILDGDLPKINCFNDDFSEKYSASDGAIHTVVVGRIMGIAPAEMYILAKNNVHLHVYNETYISEDAVLSKFRKVAPDHFHVEPHCSQFRWVKELSKYDAGWLHSFECLNENSLMRANWSDLNIPARINTLAAAGIPMIQKRNSGHIVAMRNYVDKYGMNILYNDIIDLISQLQNKELLVGVEQNVRANRLKFTFDYHVPSIIEFFEEVIISAKQNKYYPQSSFYEQRITTNS